MKLLGMATVKTHRMPMQSQPAELMIPVLLIYYGLVRL